MKITAKSDAADETEMPDKIAAAYDSWSQTYESSENATRDLAATALRRQNLNLHNRDALEIGCGTGVNTVFLAQQCRRVTAVDFSAGMLAAARAKVTNENTEFIRGDIRHIWQVATAGVDLIFCTLVLEHIENLQHVFAEARRCLRPGGEFVIYELHPYRQLRGGQAQFRDVTADGATVFVPAYLHSISEFVNASLAAGFALVRLDELRDANDEASHAPPRIFALHLQIAD